jgi:HK97 family phage major capsid protein
MGADFTEKVKVGADVSAATKTKLDEALSALGELTTRTAELEKLQARENEAVDFGFKSLGEMFVESDEFKKAGLTSSSRGAIRMSVNRADITTANTTVGAGRSPATSMVGSDRVKGIIAAPQRAMTIRDLLLPGKTSQGHIEYVKQTGFTNNAAPVAEGALKPKSDITFNMASTSVRTIAHIFKASRQMMDDALGLGSYIDGQAEYGLKYIEEVQLLTGDGTGQNLNGIIPQATAFSAAFVPVDLQIIDRLRLAVLQVVLAEYPASAFVLNPIDWAKIELTKDANNIAPKIWNLPVVTTQAMAANSWLTGAFDRAAQIFDRLELEILLSTENVDDFEKNMMTIRAEERLALAVYRPEAFVTGNFTIA